MDYRMGYFARHDCHVQAVEHHLPRQVRSRLCVVCPVVAKENSASRRVRERIAAFERVGHEPKFPPAPPAEPPTTKSCEPFDYAHRNRLDPLLMGERIALGRPKPALSQDRRIIQVDGLIPDSVGVVVDHSAGWTTGRTRKSATAVFRAAASEESFGEMSALSS